MNNPLFDLDNWREIGTTLARNKTRTFLTAFGIFWGTAMLALLWGGASGAEGMLRRNFSGFATNMDSCSADAPQCPIMDSTKATPGSSTTPTSVPYAASCRR